MSAPTITIEVTHEEYRVLCDLTTQGSIAGAALLAHPHTPEEEAEIKSGLAKVDALRARIGVDKLYQCEFCKEVTQARLWGPGWVTCPECGRVALTVAERAAGEES